MKKKFLTFILLNVSVFISSFLYAQGPGCPNVNAGADATVDCTNTCVDLTASFLQTGETNTYGVTSITYAPPFSYTGLANPISVNTDDVWSNVINLPFDFCYFGDVYDQIQVGSNGVIRFDVDPVDTSNGWSFVEDIPNNINPTLGEANIFGVCHDMDPSLGFSNPEVAWDIIGTAPCRTFVVSFSNVSHFSCTNLTTTSMVVLYETTNAIEIYVQDKPVCATWNSGNAVMGIQNNAGTVAYVPPGRNTSDSPWTASNEAWRFTPDGAQNYVFNWYDDTGASIGTANTINVCPSTSTVYTAEVVYTNCNGDVTTVTDDVLVSAIVPFTVDLGPDQVLCEGDPDVLLNADIGSGTAIYQWALDGTDIAGATNSSLTVTSPNSGTYSVIVNDLGCEVTDEININYFTPPIINPVTDFSLCDDSSNDGIELFDLDALTPTVLGAQLPIDFSVTYHISQVDADDGTNALVSPYSSGSQPIYIRIENNNNVNCFATSSFSIIINPLPAVIAVPDLIECEFNSDGFYDFDLESKTLEILNGQDPAIFSVTYHETLTDAQSGNNALISPYTNGSNPQQIFVNITDTTTGCDISAVTFNIEVQEDPVANMPLNEYVICDNIGDNDGFGQFDLSTQNAEVLGGQDPSVYAVSYYISSEDAEAGVNALDTSHENESNPELIYVRVDNNTAICYETTLLTIRVNPLPIVDIDDSYVLCIDSVGGVETIVAPPIIDTGLDPAEYNFEWTDQSGMVVGTNSTFIPSVAGNYTVLVTNNLTGCQNSDSTVVQHSSPPDVTAEVTTLAFADVHVIEATATGEGIYEFSLDGGPWQESGTFTGVSLGEHVVNARDLNGCGESSATVMIMDYPLYFTPNGDGINDTWNIVGMSNQIDAKIFIFDRYGKLLKQLSPISIGWDGSFNGAALPSSDYWFTVQYREPNEGTQKEFKAHFTLKR